MTNAILMQNICFIRAPNDKNTFYYTAAYPTVTVNKEGEASIQYQVFRNKVKTGEQYYAMLSLQSELNVSISEAKRTAAVSPDIPENATLLPLQVIGTRVTLSIPDIQSISNTAASLGNNNLCILQSSFTDVRQIETLDALLRNPDTAPIGLIYQLDYLLQFPPSKFELEANWQIVYRYLKKEVGFNFIIFSVDIQKITKSLFENNLVTIKTRSTTPDSHIVDAGKELTNILMGDFFSPTFSEKIPNQDKKSEFGFFLKQQVSIIDEQHIILSARISETTVVQRSLFPQALFSTLVSNCNYDAEKIITQQTINDSFFDDRKVMINLLNPNINDNISLVAVTLNCNGYQKIYTFSNDGKDNTQAKEFKVPSKIDPNSHVMVWPVDYQFTVYFKNGFNGVFEISSESLTTTLNQIYLDLDSLYNVYNFSIKATDHFNWDWYRSVLVKVKYFEGQHPENKSAKSFLITKAQSKSKFQLTLPNPEKFQFETTMQYNVADNSPHLNKILNQPANQDIFIFSSLYKQRKLRLEANYDWSEISTVKVYLSYVYQNTDSAKQLQQSITFDKNTPAQQTFSADQPNPELKTINLELIITDINEKTILKKCTTLADQVDLATIK